MTADRERRLFLRWRRFGDEDARDQLIERYLPLARSLARRFGAGRDSYEDLLQVASIGLLKALDRFDPDRGFAFASFAVPTIRGELNRHARDFGWALHVPRPIRDRAVRVRRAANRLELELGRPPSPSELAVACNLEPEDVLEVREAEASARPAPLELWGDAGQDGPAVERWIGVEDQGYELVEDRDAFAHRFRRHSEHARELDPDR